MMTKTSKHAAACAMPLLLAIAAAGGAIGTGQAGAAGEPLRCEIQARNTNGMTMLEAVVHAEKPANGSYQLRVKSSGASGNSNIEQGGEFSARPGDVVSLGSVTLGSHARYGATLQVKVGGKSFQCAERYSGAV